MRKLFAIFALVLAGIFIIFSCVPFEASAATYEINSQVKKTYPTIVSADAPATTREAKKYSEDNAYENDYRLEIDDAANLLSEEEENNLLETMAGILPYGNAAFVSTDYNSYSEEYYAQQKFMEFFGNESGTLFLIDMSNRKIFIISAGSIYRNITETRANEITDNVYTYATSGNYYECANHAFEQITTILEGGKITTPMKYATNAAFAAGIVIFINFIIIYSQRKKSKSTYQLTSATGKAYAAGTTFGIIKNLDSVMTNQTKHRHVDSSGSGHGGGGGFSGGGGGGGGFSGGGGGHSF